MADTNKNYLDKAGLKIVIEKLEGYADNAAATSSKGAFKYVGYANNALKFYSKVSAKYSCGFPDPQVSPIIVVDRYLDYFTTIMEDRLWQVLAKPVFRWWNRSGLSMNAARAA